VPAAMEAATEAWMPGGMMSVRLNSSRIVYAVGLVVTPRCVAYSAANRVPGESWRPLCHTAPDAEYLAHQPPPLRSR
jgi:hypothetical protein